MSDEARGSERCPECESTNLSSYGYSWKCLDCGWAGDYPAVTT